MDEETLKSPTVATLLSNKFVPLKINYSEGDKGLANMLGISSFPTIVIAGPDGKLLNTVVGFKNTADFMPILQTALSQVTPPEWMQKDLAQVEKWIGSGDYARAIPALRTLIDEGKGKPVATEAQALLADLEKKAEANLDKAKQFQEGGDSAKAVELISETMRSFPGLQATQQATEMLTRMAVASDLRAKDRSKRAQELLQQARDFYKNKEYIPCLDRCEVLLTGFGDLAEGQEGALLAGEIKNNPEWLQNAADTMGERLGGVYLALADSLLKRGQPDRATFYLNRVITAFPGSRLAESAHIRLEQLSGAAGIRATSVTRP
jgi:thioredoxin-like negative regulator of GroEL